MSGNDTLDGRGTAVSTSYFYLVRRVETHANGDSCRSLNFIRQLVAADSAVLWQREAHHGSRCIMNSGETLPVRKTLSAPPEFCCTSSST